VNLSAIITGADDSKIVQVPGNVNDSQIYTDSEWREGKDSRDIKGL